MDCKKLRGEAPYYIGEHEGREGDGGGREGRGEKDRK